MVDNNRIWKHPLNNLKDSPVYKTGLHVFNSLTKRKEEFITKDGSKNITWYMCGPTVYDAAHLGHARTYISFDILRRILTTYFGYDVYMCMNITDIDDKIILKSNEQGIPFTEVARHWEDEFFKDMKNLNVLYPSNITRVSEYVSDIIEFIQKLIDKEYAYQTPSGVYFNIDNFMNNNHPYAKLDPGKLENKEGRLEELLEGEGALSKGNEKDKKNAGDFVLWKASKSENEPFWDSPWGKGRPGWHIECSAMCSNIFGDSLDIHSGGIDLKFPHHDNEIAQTEAYYDNYQWINYFLHTGHLNIEGLKMSKSLKNFKKISDFIDKYNPNTFRIFFLTSKWDSVMDFTEDGLQEAYNNDKYISEFFRNVKVWMRENDLKKNLKFDSAEINLMNYLGDKKKIIHEALCDNFNTGLVLKNICEIISKVYEYETKTRNSTLKIHLIYNFTHYLSFICKSFGLIYRTEFIDYFIYDSEGKTDESKIAPFIEAIAKFRDSIKSAAAFDKDLVKVLDACNEMRDEILPQLGVKLEDRGKGNPSVWKLYDRDELLKEMKREKEKKENDKLLKEQREKEKELKLSTPAKEWYSMQTELYSKYDEEGIPTHDKNGFEIPKEIKNKIKKEFKKHDENHKKWLEKNQN